MNKPITLLIPNGTSPKNVGDAAMTSELFKILKSLHPQLRMILYSFDHSAHSFPNIIIKPSIYEWIFFPQIAIVVKIYRLFIFLLSLCFLKNQKIVKSLSGFLYGVYQDYLNSDIVLFAPGGYLRSSTSFTQHGNIFMQLVPFLIARILNKTMITAPISIGPFSYRWHERMTMLALSWVQTVVVRESISLALCKKLEVPAILSTDTAFNVKKISVKKSATPKIGLVIRNCFENVQQQIQFEQQIIQSIAILPKKRFRIQPIIQVNAPQYHDEDAFVTDRVVAELKKRAVVVDKPIILSTPDYAKKIYASLDFLITVRLHGAIIAATQLVPSLIFSYEYKAEGIFKDLGLSSWVISKNSSFSEMSNRMNVVWKNRLKEKRKLATSLKKISLLSSSFHEVLKQYFPTMKNNSQKRIPTVTVAVSAFNEEQNIQPFLYSVMKQQQNGFVIKQIIVVSDGSTDETITKAEQIKGQFPVKVFNDGIRKGKSQRLNEIYQRVTTDYLIQSDADVVFAHPNVISEMIRVMELSPTVGLSGGNPTPVAAQTFTEQAVNATVEGYMKFRHLVRDGNNPFSADGRLLCFRKQVYKKMRIPTDMIANDRFAYYWVKNYQWEYSYVSTATVYFRSPQTIQDQIRQNTRFVAAPPRMKRYFSSELINREEAIPLFQYVSVGLTQVIKYPFHFLWLFMINRYCHLLAFLREKRLTALWAMAVTTKRINNRYTV